MKGLTDQLDVGDDRADLTPLIDCVFLLLLFFVVTAVFVEESSLFQVELPKAAHAELREIKDVVVVSVAQGGQFSVGQDYVADDQLWSTLKAIDDRAPIRTLIIKGDRRCPYDKVVMAMDVAHALDVPEISLAVEEESAATP